MSVFELIDAQCAEFTIEVMTRNLPVSRSGFYAWKRRRTTATVSGPAQLRADRQAKILTFHQDSRGTYDSARIHADLIAGGERISVNTVAKVMAAAGIAGISLTWTGGSLTVRSRQWLRGRSFDQPARGGEPGRLAGPHVGAVGRTRTVGRSRSTRAR